MGLSNLIREAEEELSDPITLRPDAMTLAKAEELAGELGISRASVLRDAMAMGMCDLMAQWHDAQENAKKAKKRASA